MLSPLTRTSLTEEALYQIKKMITSNEISVGEKLPTEHQLVDILKISRSTVREALITLQSEGYIEIRRGQGAFVIDKDEFDRKKFIEWFKANEFKVQELHEWRMAIEPMAASLAAQRITDQELSELHLINNRFIKAVQDRYLTDIVKEDEYFHEMIIKACKNKLFTLTYFNYKPALHEYRRSSLLSPPANPDLSIEAHLKIYHAIKSKNSTQAYEAMLDHIKESQGDIISTAQTIFSSKEN
ncbi:FadR/GntR family transcriptional regulator [Bacillus sp. 03113]|uniref:FadR/GntR family transcriptional regulator n=1 Tax=Bacillus sp. 03113 TaxID=2578211 RepID=UPI001144F2C0|nr:FadR/GntR family transcriptional regulator [Bacillus sp. 03113]